MRNVRRRRNPLQSGLCIVHLALPAFHLYNLQFALLAVFQHLFPIQHESQLTASESVKVRNFKLADKGNAVIFRQITLYLQSAYGIGAIQYDKFLVVLGSGFHGKSHGTDVGE